MPCKCLTGCINKKCSCRAKGISCTEECTYCSMKDKYECYNVPGKEPPVKTKAKSKPKSKRGSRKNSKSTDENDSDDNDKALVVSSREIEIADKKDDKGDEEKVIHQTVIINNYYSHNEYKQQNNTYTQVVNHHYDNIDQSGSSTTNPDHSVNHLIKNLSLSDDENDGPRTRSRGRGRSSKNNIKDDDDDDDDNEDNDDSEYQFTEEDEDEDEDDKKKTNKARKKPISVNSPLPKLTQTLANDFLKFYWECLSVKDKTKYLEKYVSSAAELRIQGVPFIGAKVIVERLQEAAPMKVNKMDFNIFPVATPTTSKKFSVTDINNKLLQQQPAIASASAANASSEANPVVAVRSSRSSSSSSLDTSSSTKPATTVQGLLTKYHQNQSKETKDSKSLVFTNPNLPSIGHIETKGVMMDTNGYTADFTQNFYLVFNKISNVVQIKTSELTWKT